MNELLSEKIGNVKPFLKWAGGKGQLIAAIEKSLPSDIGTRKNLTYIEPFIGSGAIMFWFLKKFPNIENAVINDINKDLYLSYLVIKNSPHLLIEALSGLQAIYYALNSEESRKSFYIEKRIEFNTRALSDIENTAALIFLNRTCFNGLYRVNSKSHFNVPFGKHINPKICDKETIMADSALLQKVHILNGDYSKTIDYSSENSFFYFDPPYKPISKTASFNAYSNEAFNDDEQKRLKEFCDLLTDKNHQWLLSNSDPRGLNPDDAFFDDLYNRYFIHRVMAKRSINSNSAKRGEIKELLISNYEKAAF